MDTRPPGRPLGTPPPIKNLADQISELSEMGMAELLLKYEELFNQESRSHNAAYLRKRIAYRIQEVAQGGLSERARSRIAWLAKDMPLKYKCSKGQQAEPPAHSDYPTTTPPDQTSPSPRDPRLPAPGSIIIKDYQGITHEIRVLDRSFEYRGVHFKSLSRIAKEITGTTWNGFSFFGCNDSKSSNNKGNNG